MEENPLQSQLSSTIPVEELEAKIDGIQLESSENQEPRNPFSAEVTLRPLHFSDADDFMEWFSDEQVSRYCSWDTFNSKEEAMKYVADTALTHPWYRAICLDGKPVGSISVSPFAGNDRCRGELGYVIASKYWGKGIATKAVKIAALSVFDDWPYLERIEAVVDVENPGSQKVLEKVGFKREGVLRKYYLLKGRARDAVMYSLLPSDLQS